MSDHEREPGRWSIGPRLWSRMSDHFVTSVMRKYHDVVITTGDHRQGLRPLPGLPKLDSDRSNHEREPGRFPQLRTSRGRACRIMSANSDGGPSDPGCGRACWITL